MMEATPGTGGRCRWSRVERPAEPDPGAALVAQMHTDELRELLERYPELEPNELRHLRRLYG